ncbi:AraC family transcriptional regulator [Paraburkholderia sp. SOS3]|jgi:AraC-like DNA-binding protein|uniref:AraC family transcriptional regulator n=1 Tax=Paraburkholderia sp. SOS3 TaxID=1926494 RepID=UPI00094746CC|nr:AraC family transcriptional regulator [Paraburkholderia sp. SOS3]APR38363.1 AraC family transcriptional regulator [Paraburkholderia sp. SOS3]
MEFDPLSDFLQLVEARLTVSGGFSAGGAWAIRFPKPDHLKFFALTKGNCWLHMDGDATPLEVREGDVFLISEPRSFMLCNDLHATPIDARTAFSGSPDNRTAVIGNGEDCTQVGGHVRVDQTCSDLIGRVLPPLIHIRANSRYAAKLRWLLEQIVQERTDARLGATLISNQLALLLFVQTLRTWLEAADPAPCGWLRAANDKRLVGAIALMHRSPGRQWQLHELAKAAGMSRTGFATHFKAVSGVPVLAYLTQWRMLLAQHALRNSDATLSTLAGQLGYGSESAFSNAFKRVIGVSPAHYRSSTR